MTDTGMNHIHLHKEHKEKQVGGKFMEEKNFTRKEEELIKMSSRHFRMWLLYLKLIFAHIKKAPVEAENTGETFLNSFHTNVRQPI